MTEGYDADALTHKLRNKADLHQYMMERCKYEVC